MTDANRIERFRQELAELKTTTKRGTAEHILLRFAVVLMAAGALIGFGAFLSSHHSGTDVVGQANQRDMIVLALAGVALTIVGAALYLRHSFVRFLRFWMVRYLYESQTHNRDEVVEPASSEAS